MKPSSRTRIVLITVICLIIVLGGILVFVKHSNSKSTAQKQYEACLKEPQQFKPNGCAPPGYCDGPADGYVKCDK